MIEKILEWGGIIFVVIGIICLFLEAFACLRRKSNPKLTIAGMVFLVVSVVGYIVTEILLRDKKVPVVFSVIWIALLWMYLICNTISAITIARKNRMEKRAQQNGEAEADSADGDNDKVNISKK